MPSSQNSGPRARNFLPLIVIVGPTASGKTGLAIRLAREFGGEIVSGDSRAVFKGLDIGTAKPSLEERQGIPHWGFDLVEPDERFTAADFQAYARQKIAEIRARCKVPFLVGGTGLYVDAVVYDFEFSATSNDAERRRKFEQMSLEEMYKYCDDNNIRLPENYKNKRYVINAILRNGANHKRNKQPAANIIIVGITTENEILRARIDARAEQMFSSEMFREARQVAKRYGWKYESMTGNIYPLIQQYLTGEITLDGAKERCKILDWRLAKRQLTWFRRNDHITWLSLDEAYKYLARELARVNK